MLNVKGRITVHNLELTWQYPLSMFYSEQWLYVVGVHCSLWAACMIVIHTVLIATRCITND